MGPSSNPTPKRKCSQYSPGHEAFYMRQMSVRNRGGLVPCELLEVDGLSVTVRVGGDRVRTFWTHDADLLRQCLDRSLAPDFELSYGQGLLTFEGTVFRGSYATAKCLHVLEQTTDCDIDVAGQ